ncbi:hypothetical protein FPZ43_01115 [Mucilaginibacter pallidiroseus]|uniref:Hint domain-containing protein n=1 Tax=Mucilaginibacter pallidiroseus TaxID=2599295 RepID=A0A563UII8_9SPHI|nr:Hint domain-containing protein [Mucilaginibacter pallidiroseus]TWR31113.1 hypothetical protein FPZ43_01115 [Mucilaginibacter pallidiroseus]
MRKFTLTLILAGTIYLGNAQTVNPRPLTMAEYTKAQTFSIGDLDKDTYVKFENVYILDRYEGRKPYFITGSDGLKKRIDLYKLVAKEGMQELGTMVFYTNEKGKIYKTLVPNFTADGKVWEKYFEDIDNINKIETNFILKLSYVLSKEFSFMQYKLLNGGKDMKEESATYGNDICFPGTEVVAMANGGKKLLKDVMPGDEVVTVDPATKQATTVKVKELTTHEPKNYALTKLVLVSAHDELTAYGHNVLLNSKVLQATPNHPMMTKQGNKKIGEVEIGQDVLCFNEQTGKYEPFTVLIKNEHVGGNQKVYNIVADGGSTFMMNGVMVMQK